MARAYETYFKFAPFSSQKGVSKLLNTLFHENDVRSLSSAIMGEKRSSAKCPYIRAYVTEAQLKVLKKSNVVESDHIRIDYDDVIEAAGKFAKVYDLGTTTWVIH